MKFTPCTFNWWIPAFVFISIVIGVAAEIPLLDLDVIKGGNTLKQSVGQTVLVKGVAKHAMEGALLVGKRGMVIVKGVDRWPENIYGKPIEIEGVLTSKEYPKRKNRAIQAPEGLWFFVVPKK